MVILGLFEGCSLAGMEQAFALHVPLEHMALRLSAYLIGQVTHRADRLIG